MASNLRELVRQHIASGRLPPGQVGPVFAGRGTDKACTGCGVPTKVSGTEFEIGTGDRVTIMCRPCFLVWSQETAS